jgi:transcriptional regulator with XRE-family HTH domain
VRARRTKLGMSQSVLAEALGLTFQQVQKYEKGVNRIGAGRLQQIAQILQLPVDSFFKGLPHERGHRRVPTGVPDVQYVADYLATTDGLQLTKAFMQIPNAKLRRSIVNLVEQSPTPKTTEYNSRREVLINSHSGASIFPSHFPFFLSRPFKAAVAQQLDDSAAESGQ